MSTLAQALQRTLPYGNTQWAGTTKSSKSQETTEAWSLSHLPENH